MSNPTTIPIHQQIADYLRFTTAHYVAATVGIFLLGLTATTWIVFDSEPQRVAWSDYIQFPQLAGLVGLWCTVCILTFWTVRLWCEQLPARDRTLDKAWQAGIKAISQRGMNLSSVPLFMILGCRDQNTQTNFLLRAGLKLSMEPIPTDPSAPIHWYIAEDRILIGCNDVGTFAMAQNRLILHRTGRLAASASTATTQDIHDSSNLEWEYASADCDVFLGDAAPSVEMGLPSKVNRRASVGETPRSESSTFASLELVLPQRSSRSSQNVASRNNDADHFQAQIDKTELLLSQWDEPQPNPAAEPMNPVRVRQEACELLSSSELVHCQSLLEELCRRLRSSRMGLAPINGALAWVDAPQLMDCVEYSKQCGHLLGRDLNQLRDELGLMAPISIIMDRMHEITGCSELIRRNGPERAHRLVLGETCDVFQTPERAAVHTICRRAMDGICRSVYGCFRNVNGTNSAGNQRLIQLLIACRGRLSSAIHALVSESVAFRPDEGVGQNAAILSGVYFAASGDSPIEQGFCAHILDRMTKQEGLLAWSTLRLQNERRLATTAWILRAACIGMAILAVVQLVV
ncbi:MAG: type VI secretion protein IcmF/TssM N-terminal domain-containing protein [Pirellula sp.]